MNRNSFALLIFVLLAPAIVGCGTGTTPIPAPTHPPQQVTVVITATSPPPTATSQVPSTTPVPTVPLTATVVLTTPTEVAVKPTTAGGRPAPTKTPTKAGPTPTATALPMKFGAPKPLQPIWTDDRKDEGKFPGGDLTFKWTGQTGMSGDDCYLITLNSSAALGGPSQRQDSFLWGCNGETTINSLDGSEDPNFRLYSPARGSPNYDSLIIGGPEFWVNWSVTLVKNLGQCSDKYHCKTVPISPPGTANFRFRGS